MKINWRVRMKNPLFWVSLTGVVLTAMGETPESFTSWSKVLQELVELAGNPWLLCSTVMGILGVVLDPTTRGICDSSMALSYDEPKGADT